MLDRFNVSMYGTGQGRHVGQGIQEEELGPKGPAVEDRQEGLEGQGWQGGQGGLIFDEDEEVLLRIVDYFF